MCLKLSGDDEVEASLLLTWLSHRASKLVEQQWPQIHKLAFALLEHDSLTGEQVKAILNGSNRVSLNVRTSAQVEGG